MGSVHALICNDDLSNLAKNNNNNKKIIVKVY
jgi:hypothetical protein